MKKSSDWWWMNGWWILLKLERSCQYFPNRCCQSAAAVALSLPETLHAIDWLFVTVGRLFNTTGTSVVVKSRRSECLTKSSRWTGNLVSLQNVFKGCRSASTQRWITLHLCWFTARPENADWSLSSLRHAKQWDMNNLCELLSLPNLTASATFLLRKVI